MRVGIRPPTYLATSPVDLEGIDTVSGGFTSAIAPRPTYTFDLHSFSILDRPSKGYVRMPPVVQFLLFLSWNVKRHLTNVADLG